MKSDDFEVASSGYNVQNERPERSDADRNDSTNCHASVLAGRSAKASTCQTSSPLAITRHGMDHLANKGARICGLTLSPVNSCGHQSPRIASALKRLGSSLLTGP